MLALAQDVLPLQLRGEGIQNGGVQEYRTGINHNKLCSIPPFIVHARQVRL